jgi:hypothetical protein
MSFDVPVPCQRLDGAACECVSGGVNEAEVTIERGRIHPRPDGLLPWIQALSRAQAIRWQFGNDGVGMMVWE